MELETLKVLVSRIHGCTFATLDTETWANKDRSVRKVCRGERVIIFRTGGVSGYEGMIRRRLEEAGMNPDGFSVGTLPWGKRVEDLPIIENNGEFYLQTIRLSPGESLYFMGSTDSLIENPEAFGVRRRSNPQGLPPGKGVHVSTYRIDNIKRIAMMGEEVLDTVVVTRAKRAILKLNYNKE